MRTEGRRALVTGGAGFVGSNLTKNLCDDGFEVTVLDSLARPGSERNLEWLRGVAGPRLRVVEADVRDLDAVAAAAADADVIFHLAAQVAVTTSVDDPRSDFEVNALGTLNVLEAARTSGRRPIVVFTSTNKVYGGMEDVEVAERSTRYEYADLPGRRPRVPAARLPLAVRLLEGRRGPVRPRLRADLRPADGRLPDELHLRAPAVRQRGPGVGRALRDRGAATASRSRIYGDGKQVRDVLYVDDLVRAFRLAIERIDVAAGSVYNIGGGPANTISVWSEFGGLLSRLAGAPVPAAFGPWRPGDQLCYVSDTRKAARELGWSPRVDVETGVRRLWDWVAANPALFPRRDAAAA